MSASSVQILAQAHASIESGNLEEAENLLRSLLEQEPDNTDAWWLLAHSVRDAAAAREALDQVLRLDPNDQQAHSLLAALDDRFPSGAPAAGRGRFSFIRPRLPRPRLPSLVPGDGFGGYFKPVSFIALLVILVAGGWFLLQQSGFRLVQTPTTPAVTSGDVTQVVQTDVAPTALPATATTEATAEALTPVGQAVAPEQTPDAAADDEQQTTASEATEAPVAVVSPAPAIAEDTPAPPASAGEPTALPGPALEAVPTYPFPTQTDAEEFARDYVAGFSQTGLRLLVGTPTLEGTRLGSTALAAVCLDGARGLRETVDASMEAMAGFAAQLLNSAPALGVKVLDCEDNNAIQRIIAVGLDTALQWGEGEIEASAFQASWKAVG